jgi:hypothetical protein
VLVNDAKHFLSINSTRQDVIDPLSIIADTYIFKHL